MSPIVPIVRALNSCRQVRENQLRLRVLCLENANRVLREQMDRKHLETVQLRWEHTAKFKYKIKLTNLTAKSLVYFGTREENFYSLSC
jgi:hypothetical protein